MSDPLPVLTAALSADRFIDPARFEAELTTVFTGHWLIAARAEEVPAPGAMAVTVATRDLLLTRNAEGALGALHNVCSHRGTALVDGRVEGTRLRCPFHGWTYGLDGALRTVTNERRFEALDHAACGIPQVPVEEWQGFVWVHLGTPGSDVPGSLGDLGAEIARYRLGDQRQVFTRTDEVGVNWKAAVDAFNEVYHVPFNHPTSVGRLVAPTQARFAYDGPHSRLVIPVRRTLGEAQGRREASAPAPSLPAGKDLLPEQAQDHCDYTLFPNVIIDCLPTWCIALRFEPVGVDRTLIHIGMLSDPPRSERHTASLELQWREFSKVVEEDLATLGLTARGMRSRAFSRVILGGEEERLVRFHADVDAHLA